jgi:hypothetical protein
MRRSSHEVRICQNRAPKNARSSGESPMTGPNARSTSLKSVPTSPAVRGNCDGMRNVGLPYCVKPTRVVGTRCRRRPECCAPCRLRAGRAREPLPQSRALSVRAQRSCQLRRRLERSPCAACGTFKTLHRKENPVQFHPASVQPLWLFVSFLSACSNRAIACCPLMRRATFSYTRKTKFGSSVTCKN